jgi:hypothetical protein
MIHIPLNPKPNLASVANYLDMAKDLFKTKMLLNPEKFIEEITVWIQEVMPGNYMVQIHENDEGEWELIMHFFTPADEVFFKLKYT